MGASSAGRWLISFLRFSPSFRPPSFLSPCIALLHTCLFVVGVESMLVFVVSDCVVHFLSPCSSSPSSSHFVPAMNAPKLSRLFLCLCPTHVFVCRCCWGLRDCVVDSRALSFDLLWIRLFYSYCFLHSGCLFLLVVCVLMRCILFYCRWERYIWSESFVQDGLATH